MNLMMANNQSLNSFMRRVDSGIRGFLQAHVPINNDFANNPLPMERPTNVDILHADPEPAPETPEPETATFEMSRSLTTVIEAHNEWFYGINGGMSVVQADRTLGTSWRRSAGERKHYNRRQWLIEAILEFSRSNNVTKEVAAARLEQIRLASTSKALSSFAQNIHDGKITY